MGIAAHPDDLDYGASGTMAGFAAQGADVYYCIVTDGSKGSEDTSVSAMALVKMRENEQRAAAKIIGAKDVFFLGYPDGELEVTLPLKKDIVRIIRIVKPDVVITTDPTDIYSPGRGFINHTDHRAAGMAAIDAVYPLARDHMSFPELYASGLKPHKTRTLLLTNFNDRNFYVDISATFDTKIKALKAHSSQVPDIDLTSKRMSDLSNMLGEMSGYSRAEAFMRIDLAI